MNLLEFIEQTKIKGGSTISLNELSLPKTGYFVSLKGYEMISKIGGFTPSLLKYYIELRSEQLAEDQNYLGSWVDEQGRLYLDVTRHVATLKDAITLGMNNDQLSIYNIEDQKVIDLPANQTAGTEYQRKAYIKSVVKRMVN